MSNALRFPAHGWIGLGLVAAFWPVNWALDGLRTHWGFFPLWLGYCLIVDGWCVRATGTSLLTRSRRLYAGLFLASVPLWWWFEAVNQRTQNWVYLGAEHFTDLEFALLASLTFTTVVPAVLGTAELVSGFCAHERFRQGLRLGTGPKTCWVLVGMGAVMLALVLGWPRVFYPFVWGFTFCFAEAANVRLGVPSIVSRTRVGDWTPVLALGLGSLICGFFWEMWNYWSYPKWIYVTPGVEFLYVFEMPALGYLGYPPFALGLVATTQLLLTLAGVRDRNYVRVGAQAGFAS